MTDFLADKRREIDDRLVKLKPLIDEYAALEQARVALASIPTSTNDVTAAPPQRRGPGRPRKNAAKPASQSQPVTSTKTPAGTKRRGRRPGSGKRANEALAAITEQPGITVPELATKMNIHATYLYRVLPTLESVGKIVKKGRGYKAVSGTK